MPQTAKSRLRNRARILSGIFILVAGFLIVRLYFVQIIHGDKFARDAMGQYVAPAPDTQERGSIFFTRNDGASVAAAVMQSGWRIAIQPKSLTDPAAIYEKLNGLTPIDRERFFGSADKTGDPYEEVAFKVPDDAASAIRAKKISGIILVRDEWRYYPAGALAAHTVGFVGYKGDTKTGVYGLERSWQDTLTRTSRDHYVNPFAEIFTNVGDLFASDPSGRQGDIITSIEPAVEKELEEALEEVREKYDAKIVGGIVMNPRTGEIIALGAKPDFNPNTYNLVSDIAIFSNPLVENIYEMGSIMKPLTVAAGIDAGAIRPESIYEDRGFIMRSGKKISNFDGKARGVVSMQEVLNQSLNTGAAFIAEKTGHSVFSDYIHAAGLGEKTGIDLPNESAGLIRAIEGGTDVDYASASFGQGIAFSPIAMVRALSALANGGAIPVPHIVTAIRYQSGVVKKIPVAEQRQVFKPETAETVTRMLTTVYDKALLDGELREERYSIAAKTGTAQIAVPGGAGYYDDRYLHSFFGYFPAHDPQFIVFLYALEPRGELYASRTLARPFHEIAKFLINYYEIPPDR